MKTRTIAALVFLGVFALLGSRTTLKASDPTGLYAVVQKVVLEPSETEPLRIQIWGAFALWDKRTPDDYQAPKAGYLYYSCPKGQETTCRNEWSDIKSVAGQGQGIGFGARFRETGRVRKADEQPTAPDVYPIRMGVVKVGPSQGQPAIIAKLQAALEAK
jgi:hypothetical protein